MPAREPYGPDEFQADTGVSRETIERLETYLDLLAKWQEKVNLVGISTMPDAWRRHFLDSAQLLKYIPGPNPGPGGRIADLGSGAGFPGLVLAIMGAPHVHLVESNVRKCVFLREVARATGTEVTVVNKRIESAAWSMSADVVCSRACANLSHLIGWADDMLTQYGVCLFHKGQYVDRELTESQKKWTMAYKSHPSLTDPGGVILEISGISRRHDD